MKKVLILATGGTIACLTGEAGMAPQSAPPALLGTLDAFSKYYDLTYQVVLNLDSSNIQPEEWQQLQGFLRRLRVNAEQAPMAPDTPSP